MNRIVGGGLLLFILVLGCDDKVGSNTITNIQPDALIDSIDMRLMADVEVMDASLMLDQMLDARVVDASPSPEDSEPSPEDSSPSPEDSEPSPEDAQVVDASPSPMDSELSPVDATPECTAETCAVDEVCGSDGVCHLQCNPGGCQEGHCSTEGYCELGPCADDTHCIAGSFCGDEGFCVEGCRLSENTCPDGQRCDPITRGCVACGEVELCGNDIDDDCNDQVDDAALCDCIPEQPCDTGFVGACNAGRTTCVDGQRGCTPIAIAEETCNGTDDDCDENIDEALADVGGPCVQGEGICQRMGTEVCVAGAITCDAVPEEPDVETCDSRDNDCDGRVDEEGVCADETPPEVLITLSAAIVDPGESIIITVQANDPSGITAVVVTVNGAVLSLDANGEAVFQTDVSGTYVLLVQVTDGEGNLFEDSLVIRVRDAMDVNPPTVDITTPLADDVITLSANIIADIQDANFAEYRVEISPVQTEGWVELARAAVQPADGVLAVLDATSLESGLYRVRVTAEDVNGLVGEDEVIVGVEGEAKVGQFTLSYTDLTVPVAGMPLTVERAYDSRVKTRRDFGVGWSLDVRQGKLEHNREQSEGWAFVSGGGIFPIPCSGTQEDGRHITEVRVANRERYIFQMTASPEGTIAGGCLGQMAYQFVSSSIPGRAQLDILGNSEVFMSSDNEEVLNFPELTPFNVSSVRLTTPDGRVFDFSQTANGIFRLQDKHQNAIEIQEDGLIHSAGRSVIFVRDDEQRITAVVSPNGDRITYDYDEQGDLVAVTDALGNITRYQYDAEHNLRDIEDPTGNTPARQIYDDTGNLVAIEYADGSQLLLEHDPENRVEVVHDRLANFEIFEYNDNGDVVRHVNKAGDLTINEYDDAARIIRRVEPGDAVTTYVYDDDGRMTSLTNPLGEVRQAEYNAQNQITRAIDFIGNETTHTYDAAGNLLRTVDALGGEVVNTYDANGNRTSTTDPEGNVRRWAYNEAGDMVLETDALGNETHYTHDENGNRLTMTKTRDGVQVLTSYEYDGLNRVIRTTNPLGDTVETVYDARGRKVAEVDLRGFRTHFDYDERGNNIAVRYPDGTRITHTYDAENQRILTLDREERETRIEYDEMGRAVRTIIADGGIIGVAYDGRGNVVRETDERGNETAHFYDVANRRVRTTDALGRETTYVYDANHNRVAQTGPDGEITRFEFDALNREVAINYPDGSRSTTTYDGNGNVLQKTDPNGLITQWSYDAEGRLIEVIDPNSGVTSYTYDSLGNQITQTDANGNTTHFEHDLLGRVVRKILPGGEVRQATYDAMGNMIQRQDYNGVLTNYTYDSNGRLTNIDLPNGEVEQATWSPMGRRLTVTDARGVTQWEYDERDRAISRTNPDGTRLEWTYDVSGNRTSVTTPMGITRYAYDPLGRLVRVTDPDGEETLYSYNTAGSRASETLPNGVVTTYSYDVRQRLTQQETRDADDILLSGYIYTLDVSGRRTAVDEVHTGRQINYTYDTLSRLIREEIVNDRIVLYTYDSVGNRTRRDDSVDGIIDSVYDENDRLVSVGGTTYEHDANGNVTQVGETDYTFDSRDRLVLVETPDTTITYTYDTDGHRISQLVDRNGDLVETRYLVDENRTFAQVLAETDEEGTITVAYIYAANVISQHRGAEARYYLADGQMSIRQLTDADGAITDSYVYDAFGNLLDSQGETENALLYNGQFLDTNTGFYYLRARWLDPSTGRFQSTDPLEGVLADPLSLHRYTYAHNAPVDRADPSGLFTLVQVSVSLSISTSLRSIYVSNLIKTFLASARISFCQLAPAYALRDAALLSLETPGSFTMLQASQLLISQAFSDISDALAATYENIANDLVDFKFEIDVDLGGAIDALQEQLGGGFGGFNTAVDGAQSVLNAIESLQTWKEKVDGYFDTAKEWYDTAAALVDSGDSHSACEKAKAWEKVGNKLIEFIPSF